MQTISALIGDEGSHLPHTVDWRGDSLYHTLG